MSSPAVDHRLGPAIADRTTILANVGGATGFGVFWRDDGGNAYGRGVPGTGAVSLTSWGAVLLVVVLLGWWIQGRRRLGSVVHDRRTIALGASHALHVIELEGRRLLVGTGPGAAPRLLTELGLPVADERAPSPTAEFGPSVAGGRVPSPTAEFGPPMTNRRAPSPTAASWVVDEGMGWASGTTDRWPPS